MIGGREHLLCTLGFSKVGETSSRETSDVKETIKRDCQIVERSCQMQSPLDDLIRQSVQYNLKHQERLRILSTVDGFWKG
jgi:hypothetical protein